ncbi:MAG: thioredoxin family protein [Bdellovibrionales bacterium]|nr:thioredoxin family protein [Bdellovibrionales bacterium]
MKIIFKVILILLGGLGLSLFVRAEVIDSDHIQVRLILDAPIDGKGKKTIGIHYKMDPHWHIYWKNPGDSGAAPKFNISEGKIERVLWPYPERIPLSDLTNFGYNKESVIFLELDLASKQARLDLEWLVCKIDCVPGYGSLDVVSANLHIERELFAKYKDRVPKANNNLQYTFIQSTPSEFVFQAADPYSDIKRTAANLFVFPHDGSEYLTTVPKIQILDGEFKIHVPKSKNADNGQGLQSFTLVFEGADGKSEAYDVSIKPDQGFAQFLLGLLFAFLGGLILNIMPCVFPILFLKAFSFLKAENPGSIRSSSWFYALGVLVSFTLVGALLLVLRASGESVGWGFQLQSPFMVGGLMLLFVLLGLIFLDIVSIERFIPAKLQNLGSQIGANGDFATGVLAVVVASPCTAPFMGSALGLTLFLPSWQSLFIFISLGIGFAFPLPLLAHWPRLILWLPKSGTWMINAKKIMAIPLLATSVWLGWVLSLQISTVQEIEKSSWKPFDKQMIEQVKQDQSVFIDFTAAWCITCQVNKRTVLNRKKIQKLFNDNNVLLVRADWTNKDQAIGDALAEYGRNSVPLYVFYSNITGETIILPELLSESDIYNLFDKGAER